MRRAAKVDATHSTVVEAFRRLGWTVQSLAAVGGGCPDLLCARKGRTVVVEVKTAKGKLKPGQTSWLAAWPAETAVVRSAEDVAELSR